MAQITVRSRGRRPGCWLALALIGTAGLVGCESGSSPKDDAANTARAFAAAYLGDRPQRACSLMSESERLSFARKTSGFVAGLTDNHADRSCAQAIELTLALAFKASSGEDGTDDASLNKARRESKVAIKLLNSGGGIGSIEVDPDTATASDIAGLGETPLGLVIEDGQWKVDEFGDGTPSGPPGPG